MKEDIILEEITTTYGKKQIVTTEEDLEMLGKSEKKMKEAGWKDEHIQKVKKKVKLNA